MNILKYFLFLTLLMSSSVFGKDVEEIHLFRPSIRVGVDLSGFLTRIWQPETMQLEFTADGEFKPDWFISAEAGYLDIDISRKDFDYISNGLFIRLGSDYNVLKKREPESNDVVLLSARYGYSLLTHSANRVSFSDTYWGDYDTFVDSEIINSHWIELGFGLKTEVFRGLFLSWTIRGRYLFYSSRDPLLDAYNIPGFGNLRGNNTAISIHYGISYRIAL